MTKSITKNTDYTDFLSEIKSRIRDARIAASRVMNRGLVALYWSIGKDIVEKQEKLGWGKAVVERLSKDLKNEFPGTSGFSERNLWDMPVFMRPIIPMKNCDNLSQKFHGVKIFFF